MPSKILMSDMNEFKKYNEWKDKNRDSIRSNLSVGSFTNKMNLGGARYSNGPNYRHMSNKSRS